MWLPLSSLRLVAVSVSLCLLLTSLAVVDDFPTSVLTQTPNQLIALLKRASDSEMIATSIEPSPSRGGIQYSVAFAKNTGGEAWVFLVNIDRKRLNAANKEYANEGYENTIQCSASAGGKLYYTALWTRAKAKPVALVLPSEPIPTSGQTSAGSRPLDDMIVEFLKEHNVSGVTIAVAKDGRLVYSRGFGYADVTALEAMQPDAQMRIASISKPVTSVAIMMLVQQGQLTMDEPVAPLLEKAGFPKATGDERWNKITVRHLLNHSGGWDRDVSKDPMFQVVEATKELKLRKPARQADIVRWKLGQPLDFDPGQKYAYSNFGYCILGRIVAVVSGKSYEDWVAENILAPRGMKDTRPGKTPLSDRGQTEVRYHMQQMTKHSPFWASLPVTDRGRFPKVSPLVEEPYGRWDLEVMDAHGGWVSSATDLLRFVAGLDDADAPLLSESSRQAMVSRPQLSTDQAGGGYWYGCGWSVRPRGGEKGLNGHSIWHNGALAGTSTLLVRRWDGFSWAVLFNTDSSQNGERLSGLIDSKMHQAIDSVSEW